jgi:hypothetical protein
MDDLFRRKESPLLCSLDNFKALEGAVFVGTRRARFNRSALEAEQQIVNPSSSGQGFPRPRLDRSFVDVVKQRSLPIGRSPLTGIRMSATQGTVRPPLICYPLYV